MTALVLCLVLVVTAVFPAGAQDAQQQDNLESTVPPISPRSILDYRHMGWGYMLNDTSYNNITQGFRSTNYPNHLAIDIGGSGVSQIDTIAVYDGRIDDARWNNDLGNYIVIETNSMDPNGNPYAPAKKLRAVYCHLQSKGNWEEIDEMKEEDRWVTKGTVLAKVGNTGDVAEPAYLNYHLHFYVTRDGTNFGTARVNPELFYPSGTFTGDLSSASYSGM